MPQKRTIERPCEACGRTVFTIPSAVARGQGRYCSRGCAVTGQHRTVEERFWTKVRQGDGCWEWTGHRIQFGYGRLWTKWPTQAILAHRFSWELHVGPIPEGLFVLHHCDNPPCVRPDHLFLGTLQDNNRDMYDKGRNRSIFQDSPPLGEAHGMAKLNNAAILSIRERYADGRASQVALSREYDVHVGTIAKIIHRKAWRHLS